MALGAHEIPILVQLGPVQNVVVFDLFVGIEMKPTLTTLLLWPVVPGNGKRLQATIRKLDEILLKGLHAERVLNFKVCELSVRPIGLNEELSFFFEKPG